MRGTSSIPEPPAEELAPAAPNATRFKNPGWVNNHGLRTDD